MKKWILAAIAIMVVLFVAVVVLFVKNLDRIVKVATEKTLSYVLLVDVSVGGADVQVAEGTVRLYGLKVDNPDGYKSEQAFSFEEAVASVDTASFRTDTFRVKEIFLKKPSITIEQQSGQSNIHRLIQNASRFQGKEKSQGEGDAPVEVKEKAQKEVVIDVVRIEETEARFMLPAIEKEFGVTLPDMKMENFSSGKPMTVAEALTKIMRNWFKALLNSADGITGPVKDALMDGGKLLQDAGAKTGETLQKGAESAGKTVQDGAEKAGSAIKGGLDSLFNRDE